MHMMLMSSAGDIYSQAMDEESQAKHGPFYVTNTLEVVHSDIRVNSSTILPCLDKQSYLFLDLYNGDISISGEQCSSVWGRCVYLLLACIATTFLQLCSGQELHWSPAAF